MDKLPSQIAYIILDLGRVLRLEAGFGSGVKFRSDHSSMTSTIGRDPSTHKGGTKMRRSLAVGLLVLAGCGGGGGGSTNTTPTTPTTPTPQPNRAPVVTSVTATPTFGVQDFGIYTFNASATDADGDIVTFAWDIAGNSRSGSTVQAGPFSSGGTGQATVTVSDGKGGSATGSVQFIVGTMTGTWSGRVLQSTALPTFSMNLTQAVGVFAGTITTPAGNGQVGPTGAIATINATGQITMRIKVAPFTDFFMTGQMDGTGRGITGTVSGSGFTGQPFVMAKQ